jgi:hypothetical protein
MAKRNMTSQKNSIVSGMMILLLGLLPGCAAWQKGTGLSGKESRMSDDLLRSQVLRYKAQAEIEMATMNQLLSQLAPADAPFTPEAAASVQTAFAQMVPTNHPEGFQEYGDSIYQYYLLYEELSKRGADMSGLELEFENPLPTPYECPPDKYYSPPPADIPSPPEIQANANEAL